MMRITRLFLIFTIFCLTFLPRFVSAQNVSEKARRHMDRGQAAIEMAKTPADLNDAANEFQRAIDLAPNWPDPYYNLGMVQEKLERFDDAIRSLIRYLELAPQSKDAPQVKQLINKIGYKKEKADKSQSVIKTLTGSGGFRRISGDVQPVIPREFRLTDGKLEAAVYLSIGKKWIPVAYDGKQLQFEFTWYHCPFEMLNGCPWKVLVKSEIISTSPLRLKNKAVWTQQYGDYSAHDDEFVLEWVNDSKKLEYSISRNIKETVANTKDIWGDNTLHSAVILHNKEMAESLIANGADVNAKDEHGYTPLHLSIDANMKVMSAMLIAKGADINAKDNLGNTPLLSAVICNYKEIAELLISKGANVNVKDNLGNMPLLSAVIWNYKEIAELLISKGANVNAKSKDGTTILEIASGLGHTELVKLLIENGADKNAKKLP